MRHGFTACPGHEGHMQADDGNQVVAEDGQIHQVRRLQSIGGGAGEAVNACALDPVRTRHQLGPAASRLAVASAREVSRLFLGR